jgi:hypothetical protein
MHRRLLDHEDIDARLVYETLEYLYGLHTHLSLTFLIFALFGPWCHPAPFGFSQRATRVTEILDGTKMKNSVLFAAFLAIRLSEQAPPRVEIQTGYPAGTCANYYVAQPDDTCYGISRDFGLDMTKFTQMNPQLEGVDNCPQNLWAGYAYCVDGGIFPHGDGLTGLDSELAETISSTSTALPSPSYEADNGHGGFGHGENEHGRTWSTSSFESLASPPPSSRDGKSFE